MTQTNVSVSMASRGQAVKCLRASAKMRCMAFCCCLVFLMLGSMFSNM